MGCNLATTCCRALSLRPHNALAGLNVVRRAELRRQAGCEADAPAPENPGYVDAGAPKPQRPTMCLTLEAAQLGQAACDAANGQVQRLCPCAAASA